MVKRIAVTGRPGCGKTTLCRRLSEQVNAKTGGLITEEIRQSGSRVGFRLEDLTTGETGLLSHVDKCSGPKVGKYYVCLNQLSEFTANAIDQSLNEKELLIIDEIGPMELKSEQFVSSVKDALQTDLNLLFTIHGKSNHPLLNEIRKVFQVNRLTKNKRDKVFEKLYEALSKSN